MFRVQPVQKSISHPSRGATQRRLSLHDSSCLDQVTANMVDPIGFTVTLSIDMSAWCD